MIKPNAKGSFNKEAYEEQAAGTITWCHGFKSIFEG